MILDFRPRLENHGKDCRWQKRMVSPATAVAATRSASDSNLRCRKKEWPACSSRRGNDLPHTILIFVAAKKNGFACSERRGNNLPRLILIFVAAKENGFA